MSAPLTALRWHTREELTAEAFLYSARGYASAILANVSLASATEDRHAQISNLTPEHFRTGAENAAQKLLDILALAGRGDAEAFLDEALEHEASRTRTPLFSAIDLPAARALLAKIGATA